MSTHLLLESAVRTLVMGAIIFVSLRLLRIEQIRARRTAWLLALAGALAMPFLVAAHIGPRLLPELAFSKQPIEAAKTPAPRYEASASVQLPPVGAPDSHWQDRGISVQDAAAGNEDDGSDTPRYGDAVLTLAIIGYCVVAAVLALRLCAGVGFALRLKNQAERVIFPFDPELDTRASARLATPVTIGSSVLLPKNFTLWDGATLRIVLSHERAHVRQKDFYVHLLARLHCALFWFNPFSWWLQRQLSELGEALSDCAAVEQAESRTSYAETLLAFATGDHSPLTGVAMASSSNLTPRIERLLSDQGFERSFAPKQRLPIIAGGVVVLAIVAATSTVRVDAATSPSPSIVSSSTTISTSAASEASEASEASAAPAAPAAPAANAAPADPSAPTAPPAKKKPARVKKVVVEDSADNVDVDNFVDEEEVERIAKDSADEEVLAIRSGDSHIMINSGSVFGSHPTVRGDYIYFQNHGKPYLIQDPKIIAQAQALLAPTKELREKQRELGQQQRVLGQQQRMLASQERDMAHDSAVKMVQSAEFKRNMEELRKRLKEIDLPQVTAQIDERALADVDRKSVV